VYSVFLGPLIALTGYGQEEDKLRAKEAGFRYHLTKPVSMVDIESVLAQVERDLLSTS
jgi:CheY-like chemotaxis protein